MNSSIFQIQLDHKISKKHYLQENQKILKAIKNKTDPLIMSPRVVFFQLSKKLKMNWKSKENRPTFHYFYKEATKLQNSIRTEPEQSCRRIKNKNENFFIYDSLGGFKKSKKIVKTADIRQLDQDEFQHLNESTKFNASRLPAIKKDIEQKKIQLARSIQQNFLEFQRDNFRPINEQKVCNLEYLLNRMSVGSRRNKIQGQTQQPLRGYENLSPNKLKQYVELFKKKMKAHPRSIYASKNRIPHPKSNTQADDSEEKIIVKLKSSCERDQKRTTAFSKKQIESKKSTIKSIASRNEIRKTSEKKKTLKSIKNNIQVL